MPTARMIPPSIALTLAAALCAVDRASAQSDSPTPRVVDVEVVRMDGSWITGRLQRIDDDAFTVLATAGASGEIELPRASLAMAAFRDRSDRLRRMPRPSSVPRMSDVTGVLELVDGQSLPGTQRVDAGKLVWDHRWLGAMPIEIDRTARLRFTGIRPIDRSDSLDRVLLINGDRLEGFIESIGEDVVLGPAVPTGKQGKQSEDPVKEPSQDPRTIALDRIACIAFADMPTEASGHGDGVEIRATDGTVIIASNVRFDPSIGWRYRPADPGMPPIREEIAFAGGLADPISICFATTRIRDLASIAPARLGVPDGEYRYDVSNAMRRDSSDTDAMGLGSFSIDSPVVVEWAVPRELHGNGARLVATVAVASESELRDSGAVEIELGAGASARASARLGAGTTHATLRIEFDPADSNTLTLTVRDGGDGPVGDRIRCSRGLLISPPSSPSR